MLCPRCGRSSTEASEHCPACGAALLPAVPFDTTGLPPGATFGPSREPETMAATFLGSAAGAEGETGASDEGGSMPAGPLAVGQAFSARYHIIKLLGVGGMGAVYQAWDAELGVAVALKVIRVGRRGTASPELEKRFKTELLLARQVTHKNVVRIHDLGELQGIKYITMPYVQGDDLGTILRRDGKRPVDEALRIARQIASGLQAAHDAGVVHRDLKPPNVMISGAGVEAQALIMDFGISAPAAEANSSGGVIGTLEYMAPEQSTGGPVDARADIYAFGLILYEMLVGPRPSPSTTQARIDALKVRIDLGFPSVRVADASIPEPLAQVVARCLESDAAARYQTSAALNEALDALDDHGELIPIPPRFSKPVIAAAVATVLALVTGTWWFTRPPPPPVEHEPMTVLIADVENGTGDPSLDRTLEPLLKMALEGAGFISAYDRASMRTVGVAPPATLDEAAAREIAVKQGLPVVVSGRLERQGNGYALSLRAAQAVTGDVIGTAQARAGDRGQVVGLATTLAGEIREALGDDTSDAARRFAEETLSATSLDVVRAYATAMQAMSDSRFDDANQGFSQAVELDPNFGLAYAGLAMASWNSGRQAEAEKHIQEAVRHVDRMTERERYRARGLFYMVTSDHEACVREYTDLITRYAADASAHNNLALCSTQLRNMPMAVESMRRVVAILPRRALYRVNLGLYAAYSSDFATAETEARAALDLGSRLGHLPLAFAQLGQGQLPQATDTYQALGKVGALGASFMTAGLGDLAIYEGRFADAVTILQDGAAANVAAKTLEGAAAKFAALSYAQLSRRQPRAAIAAAEQALAHSNAAKIRFLAGRLFVEAGAVARARELSASLAAERLAEPRAYARIIDGLVALSAKDSRGAIRALEEAATILDTWIGRFDLGRAYLNAGAYIQADSEFDRCLKRRGEALSLFLDEHATYGYLPSVYYYQGRVREAMRSTGYADSYRSYLAIREKAGEDPLLDEVRRRATP